MATRKKNSAKPKPTQDDPARFKRLADYVQQRRRNSKLSVRKVAQQSSLPESTIRALENPRRSDLPKSNVIGLYKIYAETLDIPASKVAKLAGEDEDTKPEFSLKRLPKLKSLVVFSNIGTTIVVGVIFVVVLAYAAWQGLGLVASPDLVVISPASEYTIADESQFLVLGTADREASVLINGQPTTVNSETGEFRQAIFLQEGTNRLRIEVVNSFSTTTEQTYTIVYDPIGRVTLVQD